VSADKVVSITRATGRPAACRAAACRQPDVPPPETCPGWAGYCAGHLRQLRTNGGRITPPEPTIRSEKIGAA